MQRDHSPGNLSFNTRVGAEIDIADPAVSFDMSSDCSCPTRRFTEAGATICPLLRPCLARRVVNANSRSSLRHRLRKRGHGIAKIVEMIAGYVAHRQITDKINKVIDGPARFISSLCTRRGGFCFPGRQ